MIRDNLAITIVVTSVIAIVMIVAGAYLYGRGYKAAWEDYRNGEIECVVKVKYPDWLTK